MATVASDQTDLEAKPVSHRKDVPRSREASRLQLHASGVAESPPPLPENEREKYAAVVKLSSPLSIKQLDKKSVRIQNLDDK